MKKIQLIIIAVALGTASIAQDTGDATKAIHTNMIKIGSTIQYDAGFFNNYYDYDIDGGYYNYGYDGPQTQLFLSYEHIWTFANHLAVGIEPRIGMAWREYARNATIGADWKFYWANKNIWRMGIAIYTGYGFIQNDYSIYVPQEGGSYHKRYDLRLTNNMFSFDIEFIPFQFTFKNVPIVIECSFGVMGMHVYYHRSSGYEDLNGNKEHYHNTNIGIYAPKAGLKLGYAF